MCCGSDRRKGMSCARCLLYNYVYLRRPPRSLLSALVWCTTTLTPPPTRPLLSDLVLCTDPTPGGASTATTTTSRGSACFAEQPHPWSIASLPPPQLPVYYTCYLDGNSLSRVCVCLPATEAKGCNRQENGSAHLRGTTDTHGAGPLASGGGRRQWRHGGERAKCRQD